MGDSPAAAEAKSNTEKNGYQCNNSSNNQIPLRMKYYLFLRRLWEKSNESGSPIPKAFVFLFVISSLALAFRKISRVTPRFVCRKLLQWIPFLNRKSKPFPMAFSDALHKITAGDVLHVTFTGREAIEMQSSNGRVSTTQIVPGSEAALFAAVARHVPRFSGRSRGSTWIQTILPFVLLGLWWRIIKFILSSSDHDFWHLKKNWNKSNQNCIWRRLLGLSETDKGPDHTDSCSSTTFNDVISSAKHEVFEIVDFLNRPSEFQRLGASIPRGLLLVGPSGTGKTLIARAVAAEAKVSFMSCAASDFIEIFVGKGAKRVRQLFDEARSKSPTVLFIDELDALGSRGSDHASNLGSGHEEYIQTLNQLLTEMDGFDRSGNGVIVMAATNRFSAVDPALLRAGRFDRWVFLELPTQEERRKILEVSARKRKVKLSESGFQCLSDIAEQSSNLSGAELDCIVNEAAFRTHRRLKNLEQTSSENCSIEQQLTTRTDLEDALTHFCKSRRQRSSQPHEHPPQFFDLTTPGLISPSAAISFPFLPSIQSRRVKKECSENNNDCQIGPSPSDCDDQSPITHYGCVSPSI